MIDKLINIENMTEAEIHAFTKSYKSDNDDYEIYDKVCKYFLNSKSYNEEQRYYHLMIEAKQCNNPCAAEILANCYRDGIFFEQSDNLYYDMLEQLVNNADDQGYYSGIAHDMYNEMFAGPVTASLNGGNVWCHFTDMYKGAKKLGLYYSGFQDLEHLCKADKYLTLALWLHDDCSNILKEVKDKIYELEGKDIRFVKIKRDFASLYPHELREEAQHKLFENARKRLLEEFGDECWNKLQKETKIYLNSAMFTFLQYLSVGEKEYLELDFSGVISLLMRAIEFELENRFCKGYIEYLEKKYPQAKQYLVKNEISNWKHRKLIINGELGILSYKSYNCNNEVSSSHFTLGLLAGLIGYKEFSDLENGHNKINVDITLVEYLKLNMKKMISYNDEKMIYEWIKSILENVESLRAMRNRASHGGNVLNINDAIDALNVLVLVKRVLKEIVAPF